MALADDRWLEVDRLFREVLKRAPEDRDRFLAVACPDDASLRNDVATLLRAESKSRGFLHRPVDALAAVPWGEVLSEISAHGRSASRANGDPDRSGERIGAYRLVRKLGRGGMATVYLAERADGLWEQQVAVKLIRHGLDSEDVVDRFLSERQILSSLGHPNIARLLDGGTTREGLPYLVMEHVEGTPITQYCDERRLPVRDRLRLFCDVGRAVQHAHQSLVVHRDLKPSNILVTDEGQVKLLDFGIAKILEPTEEGASTRPERRPLTPDYASPEQVAGGAITTASDVYQLGLLLCELLVGSRPHEMGPRLFPTERSLFREREPERASRLVTPEAARRRATRPEALTRRVRGDLDAIVLRAVHGEPAHRYPSAETLTGDVERHVEGLPVTARSPTLIYRVRKLARRRPWLVPAAAGLLLVLLGYVSITARHSSQLEAERNLAREEAERAEEVQRFLVDVFRSADPYATTADIDRDITVREALDLGADRVRDELDDRPQLRATLLGAIGGVYANLDLLEPAERLQEEAIDLDQEVHGPGSMPVARGLRTLGGILAMAGRYDSAQVVLTRSLRLTRQAPGREDTAVAGVLTDLGDLATRMGRLNAAEEHLTAAVEIMRDRDPIPAPQLAAAYTELLDVYPRTDRMAEAKAAAADAVRLSRLAYGPDHPRTALALVERADLYDWDGLGEMAIPAYREAISILDRTLGHDHGRTLEARNNLAVTLRHVGDLDGALTVHREILAAWRDKGDEPTRGEADALQNLAVVLYERGALDEAEEALTEARDIYDAVLRAEHHVRAFPRLTLAAIHIDRGDFATAERVARAAADILVPTLPASSYVTATARCRLGRAVAGQGRLSEARSLLESSVDVLARTTQPSLRYQVECRRALYRLYRELGEAELAQSELGEVRALQGSGSAP